MTSTGQQASRGEACLTSSPVGWPDEMAPKYPQASYNRARYYDSSSGRFLSEDPIHQFSEKSAYPYVSNNPLVLVDPTGLVARLYCEQIPSTRGGSFFTDLILGIVRPYHCYLYVSCHGSGHYLELYGPGPDDPKHGRPHDDQPFNLDRAKHSTECPLNPPPGPLNNCQFEDQLVQSFGKQAANVPEYEPLGPNSNTFIYNVIQGAGGTVPVPPVTSKAPGWGWTPPNPKQ
jgi:RHS repeat-associated protein